MKGIEQLNSQKVQVTVLEDMCKGCEICVISCPMGNLSLSRGLNHNGYHPVIWSYIGSKGACNACAICYWVCPDFAIAEIKEVIRQ